MLKSHYKNKPAAVLESNRIKAVFTPHPGGKMVSLTDKASGYEFLVQRPGHHYRDQPFDGIYTDGECSGFDDMFPTIDACLYEHEPWKGIKMADHGEVWALPWSCREQEGVLEMEVKGVRFPYRLNKKVRFSGDSVLRWDYTLFNDGDGDFEFLWAGHFMFCMEPGTRLHVPPDCRRAVSVLSNAGRVYGEVMAWPDFTDGEGRRYRADISRPAEVQGFEKYYFTNRLKEGWCVLEYPDGKRLRLSFSAGTVPYLGILMNENGWDNLYNIFIEPCTVCFDRPDVARQHGQVSVVRTQDTYSWHMELTIET